MTFNPIVWFEIYVANMDRAKSFYETVLDTQLTQIGNPDEGGLEMWSFPGDMDLHGSNGALVTYEGVTTGGNSVLVYFGCDDCAVEESRIESAGGAVQRSKMSIGQHGFVTLAIDTEGNMFGLHSMK